MTIATATRLDPRPAAEDDPVWAAFLRAPVQDETPEERAAFEAAKFEGSEGGPFVDGATMSAEIARLKDEWPRDARDAGK